MNDFDRPDGAALRRLDDPQLESVRYDLLRTGDERWEHAAEHLLARGIAAIEPIVRELCELRGLGSEQRSKGLVDAIVRLQLRLTRRERLPSIATLAAQLAMQCVHALASAPSERSRLASRRPQLRSIDRKRGPDS